jgi:hypothetical protein
MEVNRRFRCCLCVFMKGLEGNLKTATICGVSLETWPLRVQNFV